MVGIARREYDADWTLTSHSKHSENGSSSSSSSRESGQGDMPAALQGEPMEPKRVRYTYYTAGSGGVGTTILETSFLLAGTDVVVYSDGEKVGLLSCREQSAGTLALAACLKCCKGFVRQCDSI